MNNTHGSMNRRKSAVLTGAALAMVGMGLQATTEKAGASPSGLTFVPSTDIYTKSNFHFDADTVGQGTRMNGFMSYGLSAGIGPERDGAFGRTEVGLDYFGSILGASTGGISTHKRFWLNAKTQLYNNSENGTRVVAGFWGLGDKAIASPNYGYLLGSKSFDFGRVHLGVARSFANRTSIVTPAGNADKTSLQLGFDRVFGGGKWQFTADYYTGKGGYNAFSPGLIYYMNEKSDFQIGLIRFNDKSVLPSRNQIYIGFDYNFGKGAPATPAPAPPPETAPGAAATQ